MLIGGAGGAGGGAMRLALSQNVTDIRGGKPAGAWGTGGIPLGTGGATGGAGGAAGEACGAAGGKVASGAFAGADMLALYRCNDNSRGVAACPVR